MDTPLFPEIYRTYIGDRFSARGADAVDYEFVLTAVKDRIDNEEQRAFSVLFSCANGVPPQGEYQLSHPRLGEITLFLVPTRQRINSPVYHEAAFSLLKDAGQ